jgi:hypothetical protein
MARKKARTSGPGFALAQNYRLSSARQAPELPRTRSGASAAARRFASAATTTAGRARPARALLFLRLARLLRRALRAGLTRRTCRGCFLGFSIAAIFCRDLSADQLFNRAQLVAIFT